jgi:hypothetical protein
MVFYGKAVVEQEELSLRHYAILKLLPTGMTLRAR